jgi:hypothetical protein
MASQRNDITGRDAPDALTACNRIFVAEIASWQKQKAKAASIEGGETGAITFVQRFNATLGCFVHFHVLTLDGVFTRSVEGGAVTFHEGPAPSAEEIAKIAARVAKRMARWMRRRQLLDDRLVEERSNEAPESSPLEACMQMSLFGGTFLRLAEDGAPLAEADDHERFRKRGKSPWGAEVLGFNIHAGSMVRAGDRDGLERLCRYGSRPPFSLERISILADGRVAYRLRKPRTNGATHLVLTPVQFLGRIAALVPPPRYPLLRMAGVLAPHSRWRASVVPTEKPAAASPPNKRTKKKSAKGSPILAGDGTPQVADTARPDAPKRARTSLGAGVVPPVYARIDWASLIRRTYLDDVLACPCGGRRQILADITEHNVIVAILSHLGLKAEAPPVARARAPTFDAA